MPHSQPLHGQDKGWRSLSSPDRALHLREVPRRRRSVRRWIRTALAAGGVTAGLLGTPYWGKAVAQDAARPESGEPSGRDRLRILFKQLHGEEAAARSAEEELRAIGLGDAQLDMGRRWCHPEAAARAAFAKSLSGRPASAAEPWLLELCRDPDSSVRAAALETARSTGAGAALKQQIATMAESDQDAVVRGYARLMAADWKYDAGAPAGPAPTGTAAEKPEVVLPPAASAAPQPAPRPATATEFDAPAAPATARITAPAVRPLTPPPSPPRAVASSLQPVRPYWLETPGDAPATRGVVQAGGYESQRPVLVQTAFATTAGAADFPLSAALGQFPGDGSEDPRLGEGEFDPVRPDVLQRPLEPQFDEDPVDVVAELEPLYLAPIDPPLGFAGPSSIVPRDVQESPHFVPREDRWRIGFPHWDRYMRGHGPVEDYPYAAGSLWNPYRQNVLKGDYPVIGQHTFLNITAVNQTLVEGRGFPIRTTPFESTRRPFQEEFFGDPDNFLFVNQTSVRFDLLHANDAAFKPADWQIRLTPVFNANNARFGELTVATPDPRSGLTRYRTDFALEEWFVEAKLADLSPDYDFMSVRAGSQFFNSDFRGFVFSDTNRAVRLFGTLLANRDQFNILFFDQTDKDINSGLNKLDDDRQRNTFIANYYRQDFIFPGYTAQASYHFNLDQRDFELDENNFLARPDPAGVAEPHEVAAHYLGITGEGHIGRINVSNAFYFVYGDDSHNPIAGKQQDIVANLQAIELSLDRDWVRFRTSFFRASGDGDVNDDKARGFDSILENTNFVGGGFSYWIRQPLPIFSVVLTDRFSILPDLRSSRLQGQTNFVNPGVNIANFGMDFEITPKARLITNANYLWFDSTDVLEAFLFQNPVDEEIGLDLSAGLEYRPLLSDNIIVAGGLATLLPGHGLKDIFGNFDPSEVGPVSDPDVNSFWHAFMELTLAF